MIAWTQRLPNIVMRAGLMSALLVALNACNGAQKGTIKGKVTLEGNLLKSGTVEFIGDDGVAHAAAVSAEGTYRIDNLPPGPSKIRIKWHARSPFGDFKGPNPKNDPRPAEPAVDLPEKYKNADTSELTVDVKPGANTYDILLTR